MTPTVKTRGLKERRRVEVRGASPWTRRRVEVRGASPWTGQRGWVWCRDQGIDPSCRVTEDNYRARKGTYIRVLLDSRYSAPVPERDVHFLADIEILYIEVRDDRPPVPRLEDLP